MHGEERKVEQELREVVSIGDRVDRVLEGPRESEDPSRNRGIDRERASREGGGAEGRHIRSRETIGQALVVPDERPEVGEQVMSDRDRLGPLEMGVPRHRHLRVGFRLIEERELEPQDFLTDGRDGLPQVEALVEGDLVVPASGRVDLRAEGSEPLRQAHFDVRVHVLEVFPPREVPGDDRGVDRPEAFGQGSCLVDREDAHRREHLHMRDAAGDIVSREFPIDRERGEKSPRRRLDIGRRRSAWPALRLHGGRHLHFALFAAFRSFGAVGAFSPAAAQVRAGRPHT